MNKSLNQLTRCALLTALGAALLYVSSMVPSGRLAVVAIAGLLTAAAVIHCGLWRGFAVYGATTLLALLIVPDKGNVLMYGAFLGCYPALKSLLERRCRPMVEWAAKLLVFNAVFALMWILARSVLLADFPEFKLGWLLFQLAGNVVFVIYDRGLTGLITFYINSISKRIR